MLKIVSREEEDDGSRDLEVVLRDLEIGSREDDGSRNPAIGSREDESSRILADGSREDGGSHNLENCRAS